MNGGFTRSHTRRHFTPPEKVSVLRRHFLEVVPVSQLCDELEISPNLFYLWQREFFENGHLAFAKNRKGKGERKTSALFIALLQKLLASYPERCVIHVVLDNFRIHDSKLVHFSACLDWYLAPS